MRQMTKSKQRSRLKNRSGWQEKPKNGLGIVIQIEQENFDVYVRQKKIPKKNAAFVSAVETCKLVYER